MRSESLTTSTLPEAESGLMAALRISLLGGLFLYAFNTLPELKFELFQPFYREGRGLQLHAFILGTYVLMALAMFLTWRYLDNRLERMERLPFPVRVALVTVAMMLASGATFYALPMPVFALLFGFEWRNGEPMLIISSVCGAVAYLSFTMQRAAGVRQRQRMQMQFDTDMLSAALDRAELSMLESQIEPHFLFNTLAHIKYQYQVDPAKANRMLRTLIAYLDRALPALRRADWTLGDELELVRGYLDILSERFGARLTFSLAAEPSCNRIRLPALMIATLVENSIRHGLAPKPDGGEVTITARRENDIIVIVVRDNGVGFQNASGNGLGLTSIHVRMNAAFGGKATMHIESNDANGVTVCMRLPADMETEERTGHG